MPISRFLSGNFYLILICLLFLFTRLYKISEIPPSVYWDEASIGYNAYSILKTGKDEWGDFLPLHFRAFGEFKLPVYIYATVATVKLFDLNEFSVRISSVLFSLGVVILTFLIGRKLTGSSYIGLWSSFLITISPWFFIFSRTGFEATSGLMFYLLGIFLFLQKREGEFILFSVISFILSAYSYNSLRIIIPPTLLLLILLERNNLKQVFKQGKIYIFLSLIFLILSVIPIVRLFIYDAGISRFQAVGGESGLGIAKNYLSHFDPHFLFIDGDNNLRHQQSGFGQLFLPELIFIVGGLIYLLINKLHYKWLLVMLILLGPVPAAITRESPHALRSLSIVPFIHIVSAIGIFYLGQIFKRNLFNLAIIGIFLSFFTVYFITFLTVYPLQAANYWQLSFKKLFINLRAIDKKDQIVIPELDAQPYIFALFYLKYDPEKFRKEVVRNSVDQWGFSTVARFGKFEFGKN